MLKFLIPYDTMEERACILAALQAHENEEDRELAGSKKSWIFDHQFRSYKRLELPVGNYCICFFGSRRKQATMDYINSRLQAISKRVFLETPAMTKRVNKEHLILEADTLRILDI